MKLLSLKKTISWILALATLSGALLLTTSCAVTEDETERTESSSDHGEQETSESLGYNSVPKPESKLNRKVLFVGGTTDISPDEDNKGETLTDALFRRNIVIENDYGIEIVQAELSDKDSSEETLRKQVSTGLDEFDVYFGGRYAFAGVAQQNLLVDLNSILSMDLNNPWWDQAMREQLVIMGMNFMMTGDISQESMLMSSCLVFNKQMMDDLQKKYPYDLVDEGKWTLDALLGYIEGVSNDSLGRYGLSGWIYDLPFSFYYGAGDSFVKLDADTGLPVVDFDRNKFVDVYDTIYEIVINQKSLFTTIYETDYMKTYDEFVAGNVMFSDVMLTKISQFITSMKDDYGILPIPKYDEYQENYRSFTNSVPSVMLATSEKDTELLGNILEGMSAYNYEHVTPTIIDVVSKSKDARDPESARMIDYIIRYRVFDYAYWADLELSNIVRDELPKRNNAIASTVKAKADAANNMLKKQVDKWDRVFNR